MTDISKIRNFSIVAHIDHGKSTLADRLIQSTGTVADRDMAAQLLDTMDIERERGITIKANSVRIEYKANNGEIYILNLIDTPGHVDFAYEVSRSMRAVEGSLLVVDASQGVEAQTLANVYHALEADHEIVPVLNKVDLPAADPDRVSEQIEDVIGIDATDAIHISAKAYLGVVVLVRIIDGELKKGDKIRMMNTNATYPVDRIGVFTPNMTPIDVLSAGEMGFLMHNLKIYGKLYQNYL